MLNRVPRLGVVLCVMGAFVPTWPSLALLLLLPACAAMVRIAAIASIAFCTFTASIANCTSAGKVELCSLASILVCMLGSLFHDPLFCDVGVLQIAQGGAVDPAARVNP